MRPVRVLLIDDHEIVRAGIKTLIGHEPDIEVVGTASSGEDGLSMVDHLAPEIVVVDHELGGMTGVDVCTAISRDHPQVATILLTTFLTDEVVFGAISAGCRAYVHKDVHASELKQAIRAVVRGDTVIDPKVAGRVARWASVRLTGRPAAMLTPRESDVLRLVARGLRNKDIAEALCVSENTIRTLLRRALGKLHCDSRAAAAATASRLGLL